VSARQKKRCPAPTTRTQRNTTVVCKPHFLRNDSWSQKNAFEFGNACVTVLNAATSQKTRRVTAVTLAVLEQTLTKTRGYQETSETLLQSKKP
jgi:hypothetical protein